MTSFRRILSAVFLATSTLLSSSTGALRAETPVCESLEEWMPNDVIAALRVDALSARLDALLTSQLRRDFESTQVGKFLLSTPNYVEILGKLREFRESSGVDAKTFVRDLLGREVLVGARLNFVGIPEVLVLSRLDKKHGSERARAAFEQILRERFGGDVGTRKSEHEKFTIESFSALHFAEVGDIWMASNSPGLIESSIDLAIGKSSRSLAKSRTYSKVFGKKSADEFLRFAIRPRFLPDFKVPKQLENPAASLLVGGIAGALGVSDVIGVTMTVDGESLALRAVTIADERGIADHYESFFPKTISDGVERRLRRRGLLGLVRIHRDLARWWEDAERIMIPRATGNLTEFAGNLSLFFGGRSFRDEVLPELGDTITLAFANQTYEKVGATPAPAIPGIAVIFQLENANDFGRSFKVAFNTIVGFINLNRMQADKDAATMLVEPKLVGKTECYSVDMGLPRDESGKPGIEYNFTPSLAVVGDHVVLSSSFELLGLLVEEFGAEVDTAPGSAKTVVTKAARDRLVIDAASVGQIVQANRDFFASQNMVKKGIDLPEARAEIDTLLEIIGFLRDLEVVSYRKDDAVHLDLRLRLARRKTASVVR